MHTSHTLRTLVLAAFLSLGGAAAQAANIDLINTQVPTGLSIGANTIDASNWMAERFNVTGPVVIDRISVFLTSMDAYLDQGKSFTLALYNSAGSTPALNFNWLDQGQVQQTSATYLADGWNGVSGLNWSLGAGSYWLAVEVGDGSNSAASLMAPTGALPSAEAVATYVGGQHYQAASAADTFGLHISAAAVPEPEQWALLLAGLGTCAILRARRQTGV
jgi:hypothetical protein